MANLIEALFGDVLKKLDGYKTIIGLVLLLANYLAIKFGWYSNDIANEVKTTAWAVFGVGVAHKVLKHDNGTGSLPVDK